VTGLPTQTAYGLPAGPIGLTGPVDRPEAGTIPLRGDLAHIALAGTYLAAHYVIPKTARVTSDRAEMLLQPQADAQVNDSFDSGSMLEALDVGRDWTWCCAGPDGPSGYIRSDLLEIAQD